MGKLIFKYWLINALMAVLLYFAYRAVVTSAAPVANPNFFDKLIFFVELLLNLGFSLVYVALMIGSSLTFFFNHFQKVQRNFTLSLLSFSGLPFCMVMYLFIIQYFEFEQHTDSIFDIFNYFSIAYLLVTLIEFLLFRRRAKLFFLNPIQ